MVKVKFMFIIFCALLIACLAACSKTESENDYTRENNLVFLDEETIELFKEGKIKGIPFPIDKNFPISDVEKQWGEPEKVIDHEDIHDYIYTRNGRRVIFVEDELKQVFYYKIEMIIDRKELLKRMGNPSEGNKKSSHVLIYYMGDYQVQFESSVEDKWWLIVTKKP
jgi:hypothetical protein